MNKLTTRDQYKFRVLDKVQFKGRNERKFTQANLLIAQALAQDSDDRVLQYHQERIAEAVARGVPNNWIGSEVLVGEE